MHYGKVNGKVNIHKRKGYTSYNFLIVKNRRHPASGRSGHEIIKNFGTIRSTHLSRKAEGFWKRVEFVLQHLLANDSIYRNDADSIREKYQKHIPIPLVPVPLKSVTRSTTGALAEERVQERFGNLL